MHLAIFALLGAHAVPDRASSNNRGVRYWLATQFDDGRDPPALISLALVSEDEREYYAEVLEFDRRAANRWVAQHVVPRLAARNASVVKPLATIRQDVAAFVKPGATELWAMDAAYHWYMFSRMFGPTAHMPRHIPARCFDVGQWRWHLGEPDVPDPPDDSNHALADARYAQDVHDALSRMVAERRRPRATTARDDT
jgi:hypothetical protein